jgi:Mrp family chromosome partitioning ATPase
METMGMSLKTISGSGNAVPLEMPELKGAITKQIFRSINVDLHCRLSSSELAKLYRMIEVALPDKEHRIVQFVSAYKNEGASEIALEMAIVAAKLIGQRVLFIDTSTVLPDKKKKKWSDAAAASMDTLLLMGESPYAAIAQVKGTELYFAKLCERGTDGFASTPLNVIENALRSLRQNFDFIIIDSQAMISDAFGMVLAKVADGTVMVVEAERTRAPVATECKRIIEEGGGNLIGAVMNRRNLYIPNYLYKMFS